MFSKSSRYYGLPDQTWRAPDGRRLVYKSRRLVPRDLPAGPKMTVVGPDERLDLVAARTEGMPELFWRLCDANGTLDPFEVSGQTGRFLWVPEI